MMMLLTMDLEIQWNLAHLRANDMLKELKALYSKQAEQELVQIVRQLHTCKHEEGQSVSSYVLKMKSYIDQLECLGYLVTLNLGLHEGTLPKKVATPALHAIRAGKIQKNKNKKPSKATKGVQGKGKGRDLHHCGEVGHWRRICPIYLAELLKKKQLSQGASTSAKLNLYSSLLWHSHLGHISKKRIEKLQHDGLLNSTDIESLGKKGLKGQKEAKTIKNRQGTKETRTRVKKQPKIKAVSTRHSKKGTCTSSRTNVTSHFTAPDQPVSSTALTVHAEWVKNQKEVVVLMLLSMDLEIQRNLAHLGAYDMLQELKAMYSKLERIGHPITLNLGVSLILVGLSKEYDSFVQNYNMHNMGKTVNELHAMLKTHEEMLPKKVSAPALHAIRAGKYKPSYAPKPKNPPPPKKDNPAKDAICHQCGEVGIFIIELYTFPNKSWVYDTGYGTHICNTTQGLRGSKKLNPRSLSLYMGNGQREAVEAIENYHLCLPSGLVIVLNNCHYAPTVTRGIILVSRLYDDGFINRFDLNNAILVSKNNIVYFSAISRDGIYEIDLSTSNTNDSSMYAISNKRAKLNLDPSLLWHCRLGHISKKRIKNFLQDGLLNSIDIESLGKCVSCMYGKMARKPYSHQVERAKDLLRLIHTDVCGLYRIVSRQGASYFVTFTDDFSRYGYVYLLKHKHEVFETFKVFQKEVENQLRKTIKSLRSDHGGEYMSQEFLDYLKEHGIVT
ncbi:zinc finger, CCHC-type containing protein [Tanacetum coccineum]